MVKKIRNVTFYYPHEVEFKKLYDEIFKEHQYYVEFDTLAPKIVDCGGHIGLATMYFKSIYPDAEITVFEPHPSLVKYLHKNIEENSLQLIEVVEKAVWKDEGMVTVFTDPESEQPWYSTTSVIENAWTMREKTKQIEVPAVRLSSYITEPIDLLKMDIEGAETEVSKEIQPKLKFVKHLFIEFHANRLHRPEELVKILQNNGFKLTVTFDHKEIPIERMTRRKPTLYLIEGVRR